MKTPSLPARAFAFLMALALPAAALAHAEATHTAKRDSAAPREQQEWGIAGSRSDARRTVTVDMDDRMRFTPDRVEVAAGETVRFVIRNRGKLLHELVIGTPAALAEHAQMMKKFPGMEHDEPWIAHVPGGGRGEIVWTFNRPGRFQFACLIAGHFDAGMVGTFDVGAVQMGAAARGAAPTH